MKVKFKNNHDETQLDHHYSLPILKNKRHKIFEMHANDVPFYVLFVQHRPGSHMYSHISSAISPK